MGRIRTDFRVVVIFGEAEGDVGLGRSTNGNLAVSVEPETNVANFIQYVNIC